jgi:membrane dipeptidase
LDLDRYYAITWRKKMNYFWVDGHCDSLMGTLDGVSLVSNDKQFDFNRAKANGPGLQVLALYPGNKGFFYEKTVKMLDALDAALGEVPVPLCKSGAEIRRLREAGEFGVLVSMEGADALDGDLSRMEEFYGRGVRLLGLTWNGDNALCGGIGSTGEGELVHGGLTPLGFEGVPRWESLGGLIDLSHASVPGFWDALRVCKKPPIVSHSCCKALCGHRRNLTDEQLKALAEKGGVLGINFAPYFLSDSGKASLDDVVRHILHGIQVAGEDAIGLGSDFDGIKETPEGLSEVRDVPKIIPALERHNLRDRAIEKIIGGNFTRLFSEYIA